MNAKELTKAKADAHNRMKAKDAFSVWYQGIDAEFKKCRNNISDRAFNGYYNVKCNIQLPNFNNNYYNEMAIKEEQERIALFHNDGFKTKRTSCLKIKVSWK